MKGHVPTPPEAVDAMLAKLFSKRKPRGSDVLIDPGCGTGAFLLGALRYCQTAGLEVPKLVGVESHPGRAAEARSSLGKRARIIVGDYLLEKAPRADFIVGNPPYVSLSALAAAERQTYRDEYECANGRFDLYSLFFERSLRLLKPEGVLVFVTPEKYQYTSSARPLRRLLAQRGVEEIHFQSEGLFPGRITYPVITKVAGSKRTRIKGRGKTRLVTLPKDGSSWNAKINNGPATLANRVTLGDISVRISPGIASGYEEAFVVKAGQVQKSLLKQAHKTLSGRQLLTHGTDTNEYLLCPYNRQGKLLQEEDVPELIQYLGQHKERLMKRTCVQGGRRWYQYHDTFPARDVLQPKILCKDITQTPRFWIDSTGDIVPRHSVYYIVPKPGVNLERLHGYLQGEEAREWLAANAQRAARGYLRLQTNVLRDLPVPAELVRQC